MYKNNRAFDKRAMWFGFTNRRAAGAVGLLVLAALSLQVAPAHASSVAIGYVSYDKGTVGPDLATFDITNLTGPNNLSPDFPVATPVNLTDLSLTVTFQNGSTETFGQSAFTLGTDGLSYTGPAVTFGTPNDALAATLTGTLSPGSVTLADSSTRSVISGFSATLTDPSGGALQDGDAAVINATITPVPLPASWVLLSGALFVTYLVMRRRNNESANEACAS